MRVSYNWLKEYCSFELRAHELADRLSHAGLNVDTYEPMGEDYSLDVEVTANRPDCLSHLGMAREVAAVTGNTPSRPEIELNTGGDASAPDLIEVRVDCPDLCPHYTARLIRGVEIGPSPGWMQKRLEVCGVRPVNNVVDITNYVMLESGQPLHAFDLALVSDETIIVRQAREGEALALIDETEIELSGRECVIADTRNPVALAGIMGGVESEINQGTTDVLLEAARFNQRNVRRTCRRHGLGSESSYRFERGIDPEITDWASRRACQLIAEICGGTVAPGVAAVRTDTTEQPEVTLRLPRLERVLGIEVPREEVVKIFRGMDMDILHETGDRLTVRVPSWRRDVEREVDLVEEVARVHGYDKISETTAMQVRPAQASLSEIARRRVGRMVSGHGFCEVMTYSLVADQPIQQNQPWHDGQPVRLHNPVSKERQQMRLTCMANLLQAKRHNLAHGVDNVDIYEIQPVYLPREDSEQPEEKTVFAALTDRDEGLRRLKGVLRNIVDELGRDIQINEKPGARGPFDPTMSVELRIEDQFLGVAGLVAEEIAEQFDLRNQPALMEVDFGLLSEGSRFDCPFEPLAEYPATERDLAVILPEDTLWADVEKTVQDSAPESLRAIKFMDIYRGDPVPAGEKSIAFSLTFRRKDRTIRAEEAEEGARAILGALQEAFGARLR